MSRALDNVPGLHALGPWLPMTDSGTTLWVGWFLPSMDLGAVGHLALIQLVYGTRFGVAAWVRFTRADVLS